MPQTTLQGASLAPYIKSLMLTPPNFTPDDLVVALRLIFKGAATDLQVAALLTALAVTRLDRDPRYISTAVKTLLEFSDIPQLAPAAQTQHVFADIVGTGGDGQNTFNVSTSAAIVVAGIPDSHVIVTKHGGKASSSTSGAGDLVAHLGIDAAKINAATIPQLQRLDNRFIFLFAPSFHGGMKSVADVRKQLGVPLIFNILGPLLNPVRLQARVLGVYAEELGPIYAEAIKEMYPPDIDADSPSLNSNNKYSTAVVWGEIGLDEVAPIGRTRLWYIDPQTQEIRSEYIAPADFGLPEHTLDEVRSGTAAENAAYLKRILANDVPEDDPVLHYILLNSSLLAVSSGVALSWKHGVELARESIRSGGAQRALQKLVDDVNGL